MSFEAEIPTRQAHETLKVRGSLRLMFDPVFGPFFWGKLLSSAGTWIHSIVAVLLVFRLTGSAMVVGIVSIVQFAPQLLFAPLCGKMADRGNAPRQIVVGRIVTAFGSGGLAVWIWLVGGVGGLPGAAPVIAASLVVGVGFVVGGPALQSIVPSLVRPGELAAAMVLNSVPMTVARAAGPALGAVIATQMGYASAFAIAASASLFYGFVVLALRLPRGRVNSSDTDYSIRASLRHLRADPPLFLLLVGIAGVAIGADPSLTLAPTLAANLGGGAGLVGWLASAFGIGAAIGFLFFGSLNRWLGLARLSSVGLILMAAGVLALVGSGTVALAIASFGVSGVGMTLAFTSITTQIQDRSPDALRGRIMALWLVGFVGTRPLAAGLNGFLADSVTVDVALVATAVLVSLAAISCRPSRLRACFNVPVRVL